MQDLYLKFPDQGTAEALLYDQVPTEFNSDGDLIVYESRPKYMNMDILGIIYDGGTWDEQGDQITAPEPIPGYHVNIRLMTHEHGTALLPYTVFPQTPRRVWA